MTRVLTTIMFLMLAAGSYAQIVKYELPTKSDITAKYTVVQQYLHNENYGKALDILLKLDSIMPPNANLCYNIALCYIHSKWDKSKALPYLEKAKKIVSVDEPIKISQDIPAQIMALYYAGVAYHFDYKFDEAIQQFEQFQSYLVQNEKAYQKDVSRQIETCYTAKRLMDNPVSIKVDNLGNRINTEYAEYAPVVSADETTLIFTSRRKGSTGNLRDDANRYFEDIFISYRTINGAWSNPTKISTNINTVGHEAALHLSAGSLKLLIYKDNEGDGNIYVSNFEDYEWTTPQKLNDNINSVHQETHACISADGQFLYFTSDRPGSMGGLDIYRSKLISNKWWGPPVNLGPSINTEYDEESPYLLLDGTTLFFSSKGHESMGGFDVFRSSLSDDGFWSEPENIGYPINSTGDDVFFIPADHKKYAYYSSARNEGFGEQDLYMISIVKENNELTLIRGQISDPVTYRPIEAKIEIRENTKREIVANLKSNKKTGAYRVSLPSNQSYSMLIMADKYNDFTETINLQQHPSEKVFVKDIGMIRREDFVVEISKDAYKQNDIYVLRNVYFDSGKSLLLEPSYTELNHLVHLLKVLRGMVIEISGHTDNIGSYVANQKLSVERARAVANYIIEQGIQPERIGYKGYGASHPIATNSTESGRSANRRTEFRIVGK